MGEAHAQPSTTTPPEPPSTETKPETNIAMNSESNKETHAEANKPNEPQPPQTAPSPAPSTHSAAPLQPPTDPYTPLSTIPYDAAFEDALMAYILDPSTPLPSSTSTSENNTLPIPLTTPPRSETHTLHPLLPLPLTEERGSPYGGPGPLPLSASNPQPSSPSNPSPPEPNAESLAFVSAFLSAHPRIKTETGLRKAIEREVEERVRTAKERMSAREEARRRNGEVEREVGELEAQRGMERRVWERMRRGGGEG